MKKHLRMVTFVGSGGLKHIYYKNKKDLEDQIYEMYKNAPTGCLNSYIEEQ